MSTEDAMDVEGVPSAFGMEVEGGMQPAAMQQPPDNVVGDARHVVVAFLGDHRADEVVPVNSRVVVIDSAIRLRQAFRALLENGTSRTAFQLVHVSLTERFI